MKLEVYNDNQKTIGAKIVSPLTEFRISRREDRQNFGFLFSGEKGLKRLPLEIKIGNLSCGGSLTRLNSPELSSGSSPFSSGLISTTALTASLPGYSSFSKEESAFCQLKFTNPAKKPFSLLLNVWVSPENPDPVFSSIISDRFFADRLTLKASFTAGKFFYSDNFSSSWFLKEPAYTEGSHFCSLAQLSAELKNQKNTVSAFTGFTGAVYESPFGPLTAVYRTELKLSIKKTEFYAAAFLNAYEDVLTSSGKKLEPCAQFKGGFITKKPFLVKNTSLFFLKGGINAYTRINLTKNEHPLQVNTGLQLSSELTSLSFILSANTKMLTEASNQPPEKIKDTRLGFQIKNSWYFNSLTTGLSFSSEKKLQEYDMYSTQAQASEEKAVQTSSQTVVYREPEPVKYKIQLSLSNNKKHKISGSLNYSFTTKGTTVTDSKISATVNCRLNFKNLTIIGKLSTTLE